MSESPNGTAPSSGSTNPATAPGAVHIAGGKESIERALFRLALPVLASQLLRIAYQWVDAFWVSGLGVEATAAVTTSVFVMWWILALNDMVSIGVTAYVSQLLGAGDRARAGVAAWMAIRASLLLGLIGTLMGLFGARAIYVLMGADEKVTEAGTAYLSIVLAGAPLPMVSLTCESILRASGNTRTPLLIDSGAVLLNALLAPVLVYGAGPIPAMGIAGAGWATVIAQALMAASYLTIGLRGHPAFPLSRVAPGKPVKIAGVMKVGAPAALIGMLFSVVYIAFSRSAARHGAASMAVVGLANRIESIQFLISVAVGTAAAALVGQCLGAGRPERAVAVIRSGLKWNSLVTGVITVAMLFWPAFFVGLFTRDPEALSLGVPYLRVLALCLFFNGLEIVTFEAVLGSGHTMAISWIFTLFSLVRIPFAFVATTWTVPPVVGIAWLITITCILRTIVILAWAGRGTWKTGLRQELHGGEPPLPEPPGAT